MDEPGSIYLIPKGLRQALSARTKNPCTITIKAKSNTLDFTKNSNV